MAEWIDISVDIFTHMPSWPNDPVVLISKFSDMDQGKLANVSHINISAHTGTHMDAPTHFIKNGLTMSAWTMDATVGKAKVFEIKDSAEIKVEEINEFDIQAGDRIIFKTRNSDKEWGKLPFENNFICFSIEAAKYIAEKRIKSVGIDYLSVGGLHNGLEVHNHILGAGIWIIEGLYLNNIKPGNYELLCLPIKLKDTDGAPARVFIKSLN